MANHLLFYENLIEKYKPLVETNKEKRKLRGEWQKDEPPERIFLDDYIEYPDEAGNKIEQFIHEPLYSQQWVMDLFGDDWNTVSTLINLPYCEPVFVKNNMFYKGHDVCGILDILHTLAKSNFVNELRPIPKQMFIDCPPVYTNKDMMAILQVGDATLRKYRDNGYLSYRKGPEGDKIWYTQQDLEEFLNNDRVKKQAWQTN